MKFIHLSDPHLVAPGTRLYGLDPLQRFESALLDIAAEHADAEFVAITGDLTHRGETAAYRALVGALARLPLPVALLVGNHDRREALAGWLPERCFDEHGFVQYARDTAAGVCLFLDTVAANAHAGIYCRRRLAWLRRQLDAARARDVYVFMHHPPLELGLPALDAFGLQGADEVFDLLLEHGRVRHVFFGHAHRTVMASRCGIPCSAVPSTAHQIALETPRWSDGAGNRGSLLRACHEPPAYGVVLLDGASVVVHLHQYLDRSLRQPMDAEDGQQRRLRVPSAA